MEGIIVTLLEACGYRPLDKVPRIGVFSYESQTLKDVVIVATYTTGDLNAFDESDVTHEVMRQFDHACKNNSSALKDTSLVICHRVENNSELEESKNVALKIEENVFGFRKYILPYTDTSIRELVSIDPDNLPQVLADKVHLGFSDYAESGVEEEISEYETILQIYSKLPFLNYVREDNDWTSLDSFLENELDGYEPARNLVGSYTLPSLEDIDKEIDDLLADKNIEAFVATLKESKNESQAS